MTEPDLQQVARDQSLVRLRKADVLTGIVLAAVAAAMVAEALTFPLEGTYAGVKNAWYVSPALFPLIVGGMLFILSTGLIGKALRDHRRLSPGASVLAFDWSAVSGRGADALLIGALLTAYIVGLVPRSDFIIATALFLVVFIGVYVIASVAGRVLLTAVLAASAAAALVAALMGHWPAPRSPGQFTADGLLGGVLVVAVLILAGFARGAERRRLVPVLATALAGTLLLAAIFKYLLLVPLPREGLAVVTLDGLVGLIR